MQSGTTGIRHVAICWNEIVMRAGDYRAGRTKDDIDTIYLLGVATSGEGQHFGFIIRILSYFGIVCLKLESRPAALFSLERLWSQDSD